MTSNHSLPQPVISEEANRLFGLINSEEVLDTNEFKPSLKQKYPLEKVNLQDGQGVARVVCFEQVVPYLDDLVLLANSSLISDYPRETTKNFAKTSHIAADGTQFDLRDTWYGYSYIVFDHDRISGMAIGRREILIDSNGQRFFSGRGFVPLIVLDEDLRHTAAFGLMALPVVALVNAGAKEICCSCAPANKAVDAIFTKRALKRWRDGNWLRYLLRPEIGQESMEIMIASGYILQSDVEELTRQIYP